MYIKSQNQFLSSVDLDKLRLLDVGSISEALRVSLNSLKWNPHLRTLSIHYITLT